MGMDWRRWLFMLAAITLAGCFQQAGDSLQSTGNTSVPIQSNEAIILSPTIPPSLTPLRLATAGPGTATLPPITIIVPPTDAPVQDDPTDAPGAQSEATEPPSGFITPGSPLGPSVATEAPSGQATTTPSGLITPTSLFEEDSNVSFSAECTYIVQRGDTVYRIAIANNTSVDAMRASNPDLVGENPVIQPGQTLNLPDCGEEAAGPADQMIESTSTNVPPIITPAGGAPPTIAPTSSGQVYVVERGDTLFSIGQRFGVTVAQIVAANDLLDPDRLSVGDELIIPQPAGNG